MESESETESESEDEDRKPKGAEGLIEIENPNRVQKKQHKVTTIGKLTLCIPFRKTRVPLTIEHF